MIIAEASRELQRLEHLPHVIKITALALDIAVRDVKPGGINSRPGERPAFQSHQVPRVGVGMLKPAAEHNRVFVRGEDLLEFRDIALDVSVQARSERTLAGGKELAARIIIQLNASALERRAECVIQPPDERERVISG